MKHGAFDFLTKPFDKTRVRRLDRMAGGGVAYRLFTPCDRANAPLQGRSQRWGERQWT